jgi:hypothetical protein
VKPWCSENDHTDGGWLGGLDLSIFRGLTVAAKHTCMIVVVDRSDNSRKMFGNVFHKHLCLSTE